MRHGTGGRARGGGTGHRAKRAYISIDVALIQSVVSLYTCRKISVAGRPKVTQLRVEATRLVMRVKIASVSLTLPRKEMQQCIEVNLHSF